MLPKIGMMVTIYFPHDNRVRKGTIIKRLENGLYLCRISKLDPEDPGQVVHVVGDDVNRMVILEEKG